MKPFRIASYMLLVIGISHLIAHFYLQPYFQLDRGINTLLPANSKEMEMLVLMNEYKRTIGGSSLSMMDIQNGFSLLYSLFFFWAALVNLGLSRMDLGRERTITICYINASALAIGTLISIVYFFWVPALSLGTTMAVFLLAARDLK
jgi:hypothetical protein